MSLFADPLAAPLWNPRDCSEMAVVVRREPIDPARPELGSRPVPSPQNWIWNGRIRPGDLVAVVGEAASGKTTVLCDWMSRISTGAPFPGDPSHFRREPGEVLLFNSGDTFTDTLQARLILGGGDLGRVSLFTSDLQDWSGKPSEMPAKWQSFDPSACNSRDRRAELHRKGVQKWLGTFLKNRPRIQMVVIDHVWHHMRADMERYFAPTISELTHIARETNVVIVLSMQPNAYRQDIGPAEFLKSKELIGSARSIWHTVRPTDATVQARSLQCLKLSQFPNIPGAEDPWGLFWGPRGELEWVPGAAPRYSRSKKAKEERWIFHTTNFLRQHLARAGGVAEFHTLRLAARSLKIPQTWFMQVILSPEFEVDYEPIGEDELIQVIGTPQAMAERRANPNPPALKINCPPGAAESTASDDSLITSFEDLWKAENSPPDPLPRHGPNPHSTFPGDRPPQTEASPQSRRAATPAPHINLRGPTQTERIVAGYEDLEAETARHFLDTPVGWIGTPEQRRYLEQRLLDELPRFGMRLPADLSAQQIVEMILASDEAQQAARHPRPDAPPAAQRADAGPARAPEGSGSAVRKPAAPPPPQSTPQAPRGPTAPAPVVSEPQRGEHRNVPAPAASAAATNPSVTNPAMTSPAAISQFSLGQSVPRDPQRPHPAPLSLSCPPPNSPPPSVSDRELREPPHGSPPVSGQCDRPADPHAPDPVRREPPQEPGFPPTS